jgi:hypothetical protein
VSESRVRENRMHGSTGGRWRSCTHGATEPTHPPGKPAGLSPSDLPTADQPAAYLTICTRGARHTRNAGSRVGISSSTDGARGSLATTSMRPDRRLMYMASRLTGWAGSPSERYQKSLGSLLARSVEHRSAASDNHGREILSRSSALPGSSIQIWTCSGTVTLEYSIGA